ncbi:MAG: hypothetical protein D3924_00970 [Candidatus Electrothrix sp. AR4]|nr:hypothetical protein [Candidatus Electrothrix sp. AR4]
MNNFKCNLIVPGFAKSGTSSLHEYLDLHPDICMSRPKELHFFAIDKLYDNGAKFHNKIFRHCCGDGVRYFGTSSTLHSIWEPALKRISRDLDNPKIILVLRHPLERLLSHYNWLWALTLENRPLLEAVITEQKNGFHPDRSLRGNYACYLLASNYSYWCPKITSIFGEKNVYFLDSEELFQKKEKTMEKCFDFLGLEKIKISTEIHKNKTDVKRLQRTTGLQLLKLINSTIPASVKKKYDPDKKIKGSILAYCYKILGTKKAKFKPEPSEEEVAKVKVFLEEDIRTYEKIFQK